MDSKLRSAIGLYFHLNTPAEERDAARQGIERLAKSQGMTFDAAIAAYCGPASVSAMAESIVSWADVHNDPTIKEMLRKQRAEDDRRACIWADKDRELQGWKAAAHDAAQTVDRLKEEAEDLVEDLGEANAEADRWQKEAQSNEKGGVEIDPANVKITERMRPLNEERVADLVNGFQEAGQLQPILVRAGCVTLIAGRHRLEAAIRLGRKVRAIWVDCDDITARKMEISENLHRAELTVLERAEHINEWRRLTVAHVSQLATPSGGAQPAEAGIRKTAQALGATKDEVSRAAKLDGLTDEAKAAAVAAGLDDNQSALLKVASYADADQVEAVSEIVAEKARPKAKPVTIDTPEPVNPAQIDQPADTENDVRKWIADFERFSQLQKRVAFWSLSSLREHRYDTMQFLLADMSSKERERFLITVGLTWVKPGAEAEAA